MNCPRCGQPDAAGLECPRCGVVFAKIQARQHPAPGQANSTARALVPKAQDEERPAFPWGRVLSGAIVGVAGFFAWRQLSSSPSSPPPRTPSQAIATPQPLVPKPQDIPRPSLALVPTLPPAIETVAQSKEFSDSDRALAQSLSDRVTRRAPMSASDLSAAEALHARFPDDAPVRDLLEAVLVTAAAHDRDKRRHTEARTRLMRAVEVQPGSARPRLALVALLLEVGDWAEAEAAARQVLTFDPRSAEAFEGLGFALFRQDRNREAADALRAALELRPSAAAEGLLLRIQKNMLDERGMAERQLSHFHVRYDGDAHEDVGREILRALERHYSTLASSLDHQPTTAIPVILFSQEQYYTASGAPAWSGGVFDQIDGRIRVPIGGLSSGLTPDIDHVLIHELTHAFVADRSRGLAPRDIHEGLAQYMEGKRLASELTPEHLKALADERIGGVAGFYWSALSFVEYLIAIRGQGGMNELIKAIGDTGDVNGAFRQVHGQNHLGVQRAWRERLKQQYGS